MKSRLLLLVSGLLAMLFLIAGCGGGGGGTPPVNITGRVLNIVTGGSVNPSATVQVGSRTSQTNIVDGSFTLGVPSATTSLLANAGTLGVFTFTFPPVTTTTDVGDLWVGPERVTVIGSAKDAATGLGVPGCVVRFGGQIAITDSAGLFAMANVAYSSASPAGFLGLVGSIQNPNYFSNEFTAQGNLAVGGQVNVGEILLSPLSDVNPPPVPFNIWGRITPAGQAPGTVVSLRQGGTLVRQFTVGADGRYQFWVDPGTYSIEFRNGTLTSPAQSATLNTTSDVVRRDALLN